ncbi:MAG: cupredoxin domain-containing protein [Actinobacteria bacterium]|nr:cupredoxin domain-containing protein [Actinomycetota bacterium]
MRRFAIGPVLAVALLVSAACGGEAATTTTEPPATMTEPPTITISGYSFGDPIEVTVGQTIEFVNGDGVPHTASADSGDFDTGTIPGGGSAEIVISEPGTYGYFCGIHGSMSGTITVVAA